MKKHPQNEEVKSIYQEPPSEQLQSIISLYTQGQLQQALSESNQMLEQFPNSVVLYNISGASNAGLMQFDAAIDSYKQALKIKPDYAEAYYNMGVALNDKGDPKAAIESYKQALKIKPDYAEAYNNIGNVLKDQGDLEAAIDSYKQAININPDYAEAYYNLSLLHLLRGNLDEGFKYHEWRLKIKKPTAAPARTNLIWDGEQSLSGKHFVVYEEQGLGDIIQFCRYLPVLEQKGANVTFKVKSNLHALLQTMDSKTSLNTRLPEENIIDFESPLMSLPLALKTTVETIPAQIPYLYADDQRKKRWNEKLGNKTVTRIGLVWSGSTWHKKDHNRSLLLNQLTSLLVLPVEFHSLQKEVREIDIKTLTDFPKINQHQDDLLDFSDTAALIDEMDLVISVDTAVAHLSGAMGKKTFILLPYSPDFRWMLDRADSPWYPTATLFRQPSVGDWDSVISEIRQLLSD
jgi:Tfp pilus assembly protein PilF